MTKIKVRVKAGTKGQPLGKRIVEYRARQGEQGREIYRSKARLNVHIHDGRK